MGFQYKFEKLLMIKENEKEKVLRDYNEAVNKFEQVATNLYKLLKQKENLQKQQDTQIQLGVSVGKIQRVEKYLLQLAQLIDHCQQEVAKARKSMELKQQLLIDKNIEVKKYEIMKTKALDEYRQHEKMIENKAMDEISVLQYMNRGS